MTTNLTQRSLHWTVLAGVATVMVSLITVSAMGLSKFEQIATNHQQTQDRLAVLDQYRTDNTQLAAARTALAHQTEIEVAGLRTAVEGLRGELADLKEFLTKEDDRMFTAIQEVRREQARLQHKELP